MWVMPNFTASDIRLYSTAREIRINYRIEIPEPHKGYPLVSDVFCNFSPSV